MFSPLSQPQYRQLILGRCCWTTHQTPDLLGGCLVSHMEVEQYKWGLKSPLSFVCVSPSFSSTAPPSCSSSSLMKMFLINISSFFISSCSSSTSEERNSWTWSVKNASTLLLKKKAWRIGAVHQKMAMNPADDEWIVNFRWTIPLIALAPYFNFTLIGQDFQGLKVW